MSRKAAVGRSRDGGATAIFPIPRESKRVKGVFVLDESTMIAVPSRPSESDMALARFLAAELSDHWGLGVRIERLGTMPRGKRAIVLGTSRNPLVAGLCRAAGLKVSASLPGPEGYVLRVDPGRALVAGSDERGAFYGLQSLRQLIVQAGAQVRIPCVRVRDWPHKPFRGIRLYLPGRDNLPFFRRFLRDFMALYKFNTLIMEMNACMRFDRHPELNAGWLEFAKDLTYRRLNTPPVSPKRGRSPNSTHYDTADGGVLEKEEVAELVAYARRLHLEVVPEIPGLTHSYYLLTRHRELAEYPHEPWPDTYCPSNPGSYKLLFDVFDEYIEVMRPKLVHIGHDEWFLPDNLVCDRCKGKERADLYARDVHRIHAHLSKRGVRAAMWGDHLIAQLGRHGALSAVQVDKWIPKDILIFNWMWQDRPNPEGANRPRRKGEDNDLSLQAMGFEQIYGNLAPHIADWARRSRRERVSGGAPSSWAATTEFNFGKDQVQRFLRCANLLWAVHWPAEHAMRARLLDLLPRVRRHLRGGADPSDEAGPVTPIDLGSSRNAAPGRLLLGRRLPRLKAGSVRRGAKRFVLAGPRAAKTGVVVGVEGDTKNPLSRAAKSIRVGRDVSSLLFLHACAQPSGNVFGYRSIFSFPESADLLGWYEIEYEDGLVETLPIRYGLNIREWESAEDAARGGQVNWWVVGDRQLYAADAVECAGAGGGEPATFFACEWRNPRLGKAIKEVRLRGAHGCHTLTTGRPDTLIPSNAVVLLALSATEKRA
ncbi:MAG: beta-N-acetylhexosaminidase [Kiritimatiellae bacterium]|nr:beta-N-acetylhexosaminidase [Kiritimatiellia bacterium]